MSTAALVATSVVVGFIAAGAVWWLAAVVAKLRAPRKPAESTESAKPAAPFPIRRSSNARFIR